MELSKTENWDEIKSIIRECFSTDDELLDKYHIMAGISIEECVSDTFNVLQSKTSEDFAFYKVLYSDKLIGFIGVEPSSNYLDTFCLKKQFRTKGNKDDLFKLIIGLLKQDFICGLYTKNKPAINYLLKQGMETTSDGLYNERPFVILKYLKKEELCH